MSQGKHLNSLAQYAMMLATWKECIYAGFLIYLNRMSVFAVDNSRGWHALLPLGRSAEKQ